MHRTSLHAVCLILATAGITTAAAAQGRGRNATGYPPGFRPPPGMCRAWIEGVPPGHQPGVTDCVTARASAPYNSRVIYGDRNYNPSYRNPSYRRPSGVYSRTVYDGDGNRWIQRVQQNPNGLLSVLSSLPYVTGNTSTLRYSTGNAYRSKPHKGKPGKAIRGHGHGHGHGNGKYR